MKHILSLEKLKEEARNFAEIESNNWVSSLYGITDGKAIGSYVEQKFRAYLKQRYEFEEGNLASGIDFPQLNVDIKVTSIHHPQSSCPFRTARQKIYGLGYALLVFVYEKKENQTDFTATLNFLHVLFIEEQRTADFQTTSGLRWILQNGGNKDDVLAFLEERRLPVDEIEASILADEILSHPPEIGYLTISNALQWRLQYTRAIEKAGLIPGIERLR